MKKIFILAIAAASVATASAQDCKALYEQGKKLDDAFNKEKPSPLNPKSEISAEAAAGLLEAYDLYLQAIECEKVPNAKGKVEDKLTKKIDKALKMHIADADFNKAAIVLFNADKKYPEAYRAFMISGETSRDFGTAADTVYAVDFYNAGNSAFGTDFKAAVEAYTQARKAHINEPQAYVYNIASLQQLAQNDSTYAAQIYDVAAEGVDRFGASNDYIFGNYLQYYLDNKKYDEAIAKLNGILAKDASNANVYRLRAIVNNAQHKYVDAIPDFVKVAELSDNFGYVRDAANNINNIAKFMLGQINNATPEQKAEIIEYFNDALKIAQKAQTLDDADGSVNGIIEDIQYNLENANKL